jgi:hypothetical protein
MYDVRCLMHDVMQMYDVRCLMYDVLVLGEMGLEIQNNNSALFRKDKLIFFLGLLGLKQ